MKSFNDSLTGKYLRIALPAALEGIFMTFLAAADLIMVGVLGAKAIAAVSIFLPLRLVLLTVSRSLASAVTILTANKFGSGKYPAIKVLLRQSFTVSSILLVVLHLLFYGFFEKLVVLMGAQSDYLELALAYGNIAVAAVLLNSLSLLLQGTLLGVGRTSAIMKSNIVGNVVNIVCNYFLITGFGSFAGWGVRGAAISTIIGSLCTLGITVWIMKHEGFFSDGLLQLPDKIFWREFMPVFGGVFSELGAERIGMLAYGWMTARLGTLPYAVHSICYNICDFSYDFIFGFGKANEVADAIRKATEAAKRQLRPVSIANGTIPHEVYSEFGGGKVLLKPASPGTGLIAGNTIRAVLEAAGVRDIVAKSLGSSNHANVVKATLQALASLRTSDQVLADRGKKKEKAI